jgi:hypothetical protein
MSSIINTETRKICIEIFWIAMLCSPQGKSVQLGYGSLEKAYKVESKKAGSKKMRGIKALKRAGFKGGPEKGRLSRTARPVADFMFFRNDRNHTPSQPRKLHTASSWLLEPHIKKNS